MSTRKYIRLEEKLELPKSPEPPRSPELFFPVNQVICGDNLEVMARMPDNSVDTIITDPPYGLGFMGKEWDTFKPEHIRKVLHSDLPEYGPRGRKGKHLGSDGSWRHRGCGKASEAGQYDFSRNAEFQQWFTIWATEALRIAKPGAMMLIFGGTRTFHRLACAIEDAGWQIRDCMMWLTGQGFPKSCSISQQFDRQACREKLEKELGRKPTKEEFKKAWEGFRKIVGKNPNDKGKRENALADYGLQGGVGDSNITTPTTDLAKLWDGWGTALKPAWEPILVCMKPLDGTFAQNAEKWGVAGMNIDEGRIGTEDNTHRVIKVPRFKDKYADGKGYDGREENGTWEGGGHSQGRWPANLILDEEAAAMLDEQTGEVGNKWKQNYGEKDYKGKQYKGGSFGGGGYLGNSTYCDTGGASRFFYCPKASRAERNAGLEGMPEGTKVWDGKSPESSKDMKPLEQRWTTKMQNTHPTVKPLKLMEYLCKLTKTPTGGVVLDPFGGSGTTGMACVNTGRDYILIEKEESYCEIAEKRIAWVVQARSQNAS